MNSNRWANPTPLGMAANGAHARLRSPMPLIHGFAVRQGIGCMVHADKLGATVRPLGLDGDGSG